MGRKFTILLCFTLYSRANSKYKPPGGGGYIRRGGLTEGFLSYDFGELIFSRGLYLEGLIFAILLYVVKSSPNKVFVYFCIKNELQCVYNM